MPRAAQRKPAGSKERHRWSLTFGARVGAQLIEHAERLDIPVATWLKTAATRQLMKERDEMGKGDKK